MEVIIVIRKMSRFSRLIPEPDREYGMEFIQQYGNYEAKRTK